MYFFFSAGWIPTLVTSIKIPKAQNLYYVSNHKPIERTSVLDSHLGDARVAAAQVVSAVVHPVLLGGGAMLPEEALPAIRAPATLKGGRGLQTLTTAGALGLTLIQQR